MTRVCNLPDIKLGADGYNIHPEESTTGVITLRGPSGFRITELDVRNGSEYIGRQLISIIHEARLQGFEEGRAHVRTALGLIK